MRVRHPLLLRSAAAMSSSSSSSSSSSRANNVPPGRTPWRRSFCHRPPPIGHVHDNNEFRQGTMISEPRFFPPPPHFRRPPPRFRQPPPPRPADYRSWIYASPPPPPHYDKFTVVSYNILADYLAREHQSKLYFHIPHHVIDWAWRKRRLLIEFGLWAPDIMCLQEVDRFCDLEEELAVRGYNGIWKMRTGNAVDGCAIFWRANKFQLRHEEHIEYSKLGLRDNVAQICVLESTTQRPANVCASQPASSRGANNIILCNIHVLYNPKRGEIKLGQVRVLLERAYAVSKIWDDAPVVVCGDFNCTPKSPLYNFVSQQKINFSGLTRDQLSGQHSASIYKARPFVGSNSYRAQPQVGDDKRVTIDFERTSHGLETQNNYKSQNAMENMFETEKIQPQTKIESFQSDVASKKAMDSIESSQSDITSKKALDADNKLLGDAVTDISSLMTVSGSLSANIEMPSPERMNSSVDLNVEQEASTSPSVGNTSERSISDSPTNWKLNDVSLKEMYRTVSGDANCFGGDGIISSPEETLTCFAGDGSCDNTIDNEKSTHLETKEAIPVSGRYSRGGVSGEELDGHNCGDQVDPLIDPICSSDENSDPNFFKELLGNGDECQLTEEIIYTSSEQTRPSAEAQGNSSVYVAHPGTHQENRIYNPYLWTPMEIEVASGNAACCYAEHHLKLRSAYTDVGDCAGTKDMNREPEVTSYNRQFMGTVDYIWYSEGLQTVKVLDTIPKRVLQRTPGFPTQKWGSDHLALACEFAFTKDCCTK